MIRIATKKDPYNYFGSYYDIFAFILTKFKESIKPAQITTQSINVVLKCYAYD